ncbi:MAG: RsmB/NOP family class I SAM-dependent RNA methyltransferase [Ignavibacteriaceae bacterium]
MAEVSTKIQDYLNSLYGERSADKYIEFIKEEPSRYIRVNLLKTNKKDLINLLRENYSIEAEEIPSLPFTLKITKGKELVSKTIEHIIGLFYMQGLSSMIPPLVLNPSRTDIVLDLCAAPGSKTTELGEMMKNKGTLIANEIALSRVKMLVYNLDRMSLINAGVTHQKGELLSKIYSDYFDKVLLDAPCSGLGIIQKKEEVNKWWSIEKAEMLGELQLKLLIAAVKMAKVGGEIVYSTCTLTPEENEFVIDKLLKKYPVEIADIQLPVSSMDGFTSYEGINLHPDLSKAKRILPWEVDSDGFFIVKLRKTDHTVSPEILQPSKRELKFYSFHHKDIKKYLLNLTEDFNLSADILNEFKYILKGNDIFFINNEWHDENPGFFERIGTKFGTIDKHGKTVLHTQSAQVLENHIKKNIVEIENQTELKAYLDGGVIKKDAGFTGQCVIRYGGHILGSAVVTGAGIKSRFPRAKRTQEIMKEF